MNRCAINNDTCTAYRLTAFQTDYCLNHQAERLARPYYKSNLTPEQIAPLAADPAATIARCQDAVTR